MGDASFEYSFRMSLSFLLSLGVGIFLTPFPAYYSAIIIGFPFTSLIRKLTAQHKSLTIDISFIKVLANLLDGFYAAMLAKLVFNMFDIRFRVLVLFLMGIGKVIYVFKRNDLLGQNVKTSELMEEMLDLLIYGIGLFVAHRIFPHM